MTYSVETKDIYFVFMVVFLMGIMLGLYIESTQKDEIIVTKEKVLYNISYLPCQEEPLGMKEHIDYIEQELNESRRAKQRLDKVIR